METGLNIVKAMADGSRMRILAALLRCDELCVCQIVEILRLATATVSRHMSILQNARLVQSRKDGKWVYYRLSAHFPEPFRIWMLESLSDSPQIIADPALRAKGMDELIYLDEILENHARRTVVSPWVARELSGAENLRYLYTTQEGKAA